MKNTLASVFLLLTLTGLPVCQAQENDPEYDSVRDALHALAERTGDRLLVRAAAQLARICTNSGIEQTDMALGCRILREALFSGNNDNAIRHLVRGMMAEEATAVGRDLNYGIRSLAMPLFARMAQRANGRLAYGTTGNGGLAMQLNRSAGIEDGYVGFNNPSGLFMTASYADTRRESTALETGFTYDRLSFIFGVDRQISNNLLLGLALTYRDERGAMISDIDQDTFGRAAGALDLTQSGLSLYGSWQFNDHWRLDALVSGSLDRYFQSRLIEFHVLRRDGSFADFDDQAVARPDGRSELFHLGLTRDWQAGSWRMNASLQWEYSTTRIDAYREQAARADRPIPYLIRVENRTITSNVVQLQLGVDRAFSLSSGVLVPFAQLDFYRELALDAEHVRMSFVVDPLNLDHQVVTEEPDRNYATLQAGANLVMAGERQVFLRVSRLLGYDRVSETLYSIGGRWQF